MVTSQADVKRNGVQDYVSLRTTAAIIFAFTVFMAWFFISTDNITFIEWHGLFSGIPMKVFTLATLVSIMIHVRIGLWQVLTDYVKATRIRVVVQWLLNLIAFAYVLLGLFVLWGV